MLTDCPNSLTGCPRPELEGPELGDEQGALVVVRGGKQVHMGCAPPVEEEIGDFLVQEPFGRENLTLP